MFEAQTSISPQGQRIARTDLTQSVALGKRKHAEICVQQHTTTSTKQAHTCTSKHNHTKANDNRASEHNTQTTANHKQIRTKEPSMRSSQPFARGEVEGNWPRLGCLQYKNMFQKIKAAHVLFRSISASNNKRANRVRHGRWAAIKSQTSLAEATTTCTSASSKRLRLPSPVCTTRGTNLSKSAKAGAGTRNRCGRALSKANPRVRHMLLQLLKSITETKHTE